MGNDITDSGNTVRCHTDLSTCCTVFQGVNRGDWYFPDGSVLAAGGGGGGDIYRSRGAQVVHLHRRNDATSPSGMYRCDIETVDVHDNDVDNIKGETVYVELYPPSGGIHFSVSKISSSTDMSVLYRRYHHTWWSDIISYEQSHLYLYWWTCYHCHLDQR